MSEALISVLHFDGDDLAADLAVALDALSQRPGFVRGSVGRDTDETSAWVLVSEWHNVGSYRRALGNHDVKLRATPVLAQARDLPGSFESLITATAGDLVVRASDHT